MFLRRVVIELDQHFADTTSTRTVSFQPVLCAAGALAVPLTEYGTACREYGRMQHHVAHAGNDPTFMSAFCAANIGFVHIEDTAVDKVSVMEVRFSAVIHIAHRAMIHPAVMIHVAAVHLAHAPILPPCICAFMLS